MGDLAELVAAQMPASALRLAGFTPKQLLDAKIDCTSLRLKEAGWEMHGLIAAGFSCKQLLDGGWPEAELCFQFSWEVLTDSGITVALIRRSVNGHSIRDIIKRLVKL